MSITAAVEEVEEEQERTGKALTAAWRMATLMTAKFKKHVWRNSLAEITSWSQQFSTH